jgi:UDP-N-acetylglucosamine diphosphorylase/glucosamine-1-phosphate N-acetyltransferase
LQVIVFEDDGLDGFRPIFDLRHGSLVRWGTKTLMEGIAEKVGGDEVALWGRKELADVTKEELQADYNVRPDGTALFVNSRARPDRNLEAIAAKRNQFVAMSEGHVVAAKLRGDLASPGVITRKDAARLAKKAERLDAPSESLFKGYWDLIESNGLGIAEQSKHFEDPITIPSGVEVRGSPSNLRIDGMADVESHVTFDVRPGPVMVERGAVVESFSRVMGPCYIGPKSKVHSALIGGGTSVFEGCKVGGQVENSVIMPHTNKAHHGYVGDSFVGEWVNLGAGSTFSNLKNTYGNVRVDLGGKVHDSGALKLGPAIGDMCKVSIGALVHAGRTIGTGSQVSGLAAQSLPSFTYYDGISGKAVELLLESVVETQRRMMERRDRTLTRAQEALIRHAFTASSAERRRAGVKKGKIK